MQTPTATPSRCERCSEVVRALDEAVREEGSEQVNEDVLVLRVDVVEEEVLYEVEGGRLECGLDEAVLRAEQREPPFVAPGVRDGDVGGARLRDDVVKRDDGFVLFARRVMASFVRVLVSSLG